MRIRDAVLTSPPARTWHEYFIHIASALVLAASILAVLSQVGDVPWVFSLAFAALVVVVYAVATAVRIRRAKH